MNFEQFVSTLKNIPDVQVSWSGIPVIPASYVPVRVWNRHDTEAFMHFKIEHDSNEIIRAYGFIEEAGKISDSNWYAGDLPEEIDVMLKGVIVEFANADGDGGSISPEDVEF